MGSRRKTWSARDRKAVVDRQGGRCVEPGCGREFSMHNPPDFDHEIALELGGEDTLENLRAICRKPCHAIKTARDQKAIAKAKRMEQRRLGIGRTVRNPLPGGRGDRLKRKIGGGVEER